MIRLLFSILLAAIFIVKTAQPAEAWGWPFLRKKAVDPVETHLPPPADALEVQCDPIKRQIQAIYEMPPIVRQMHLPKREYLIAKHRQCRANLAEQQYDYLKHIDVSQPPSLRPLEDPETGLKIPPDPVGPNPDVETPNAE